MLVHVYMNIVLRAHDVYVVFHSSIVDMMTVHAANQLLPKSEVGNSLRVTFVCKQLACTII